MILTKSQLEEIKKRAEAALKNLDNLNYDERICNGYDFSKAFARTDIPNLIETVEYWQNQSEVSASMFVDSAIEKADLRKQFAEARSALEQAREEIKRLKRYSKDYLPFVEMRDLTPEEAEIHSKAIRKYFK